jgi:hypothetical protein
MHYLTMRSKGTRLVLISCALLLLAPTHAFADASPSPSPSPDFQTMMKRYKISVDQFQLMLTPSADIQNMQERYKVTMQQFQELQKSRELLRMQINRTFMAAVDTANRDARKAMKSARTASAKNDVITRQKTAISIASDARDLALNALGPVPTPPAKPIAQGEVTNKNKVKNKKHS